VICRRTKVVALREVRGINICARVDDECASTCRNLDTQRVVVAVRSTAINADATRVKAEIEIVSAHDVRARLRKRRRKPGLRFQSWIVKDCRGDVQKISVIAGAPAHVW